jgi:YD repeat-containing protein
MTAYNETCASVGNDYWNERLFLLHGDAKYVDVMERTLYNGLISGVSLDGKSFFYPNPLESNGQHERSPWFGVACCPGNITRFLASVPGYVYAQSGDTLFVNLYMGGKAAVKLDNGRAIELVQETRYPRDGAVKLTVNPDQASQLTIKVRIPGWARNEPVPSDLYRFTDQVQETASVKVNGRAVPLALDKGYVNLSRSWKKGDVIELNLPMPVRRIAANNEVEADRGRVALERGPLVYAAEWPDNPGGKVRNLVLPAVAKLTSQYREELLSGVTVVKGRATALSYDAQGNLTKRDQEFTAIPYYAWANRGRGQMLVWIPETEASAKPLAFPTVATTSKVTTSGSKNPRAINDGEEPRSSNDPESYFDWWPAKGAAAWVEYAFEKPSTVSEAAVYWFDDTGHGEVRVPAGWRLLYKSGGEWKPVEDATPYGVAKDQYNKVTFKPVMTNGLRMELTMQPQWSAGIEEWKVK